LPTRAARLDGFITDAVPEASMLVELLCEDHVGTYLLPFLCRSTAEGFRNERTGEAVTVVVVGWRAPKVVSPGSRSASSRLGRSDRREREIHLQTCPPARTGEQDRPA
jgi:hypothetical protein